MHSFASEKGSQAVRKNKYSRQSQQQQAQTSARSAPPVCVMPFVLCERDSFMREILQKGAASRPVAGVGPAAISLLAETIETRRADLNQEFLGYWFANRTRLDGGSDAAQLGPFR
jgi:hypothetical protein